MVGIGVHISIVGECEAKLAYKGITKEFAVLSSYLRAFYFELRQRTVIYKFSIEENYSPWLTNATLRNMQEENLHLKYFLEDR
uniref:Uncharacterized protein n=1 Tax=Glossina palpalis gambiensis TaxID=67801 RepID=A0A1B0BQJ3_9MUSC